MQKYFVEHRQEREREAIKVIMIDEYFRSKFFRSLGLDPFLTWYILGMKTEEIGPPGDIDILAGRLE